MTTAVIALSLSGQIEKYGAYAGLAAVLGLAVLSLLYFAQAREVKRLREWAGRAPERAAELEERVSTIARERQTAPAAGLAVPATAPAGAATGAAATGAVPGQPAPAPSPIRPPGAAPVTATRVAGPATAAAAAASASAGARPGEIPAAGAPTNGTGSDAAVPAPTAPGQPAATPGQPAPPAARPGQPALAPAPSQPAATPGQPGQTASPAATPGQPGQPAAKPGQPGQPAAKPGAPAAPGRPGAPAAKPGQPGSPVAAPGQPPAPGARPVAPVATPAAASAAPAGAPPAAPASARPAVGAAGVPPAGGSAAPGPTPPPARAAAAAATGPASASPRPAPLRVGATAAGRAQAAATRAGDGRGSGESRGRMIAAIAGGVVLIGIVLAILATQVFDGGGGTTATAPNTVGERPAAPAGEGDATPAAGATRVNRGDFTVAVLNGTTITNLARGAANKIADAGYVEGPVTNDTTNQARDATVIYYAEGARASALDVARLIKVRSSAVRPLNEGEPTEQGLVLLAGEDADVIVSVGQDQAQ